MSNVRIIHKTYALVVEGLDPSVKAQFLELLKFMKRSLPNIPKPVSVSKDGHMVYVAVRAAHEGQARGLVEDMVKKAAKIVTKELSSKGPSEEPKDDS